MVWLGFLDRFSKLALVMLLFGPAQATTGIDGREPGLGRENPAGMIADSGPAPDPSLSAEDVVRIQMKALQGNGLTDEGIRTTYRFASPANKSATGPYERFARMIKSAPYRAMLNARDVQFGAIDRGDAEALQEVRVEGADGTQITYVFFLRRQTLEPFQGCWMTEAVIVKPNPGESTDDAGPPGFG